MRSQAVELLEELTRLGAVVESREGRLRLRFPEDRRPQVERLRPRLEAMKAELLTVLAGEPGRATRREEYHRRAAEALRRIGRLPGLPAALRWLEHAQPARHRWLLYALPDNLDMLWEAEASLEAFQEALDRWVAAHEAAVREYILQGLALEAGGIGHAATESVATVRQRPGPDFGRRGPVADGQTSGNPS